MKKSQMSPRPQDVAVAWIAITQWCKLVPARRTVANLYRTVQRESYKFQSPQFKWKCPSVECLTIWVKRGVAIRGHEYLAQPWALLGIAYDEGRFDPEMQVYSEDQDVTRNIARQRLSIEAQRLLTQKVLKVDKQLTPRMLQELANLEADREYSAENKPDIERLSAYFMGDMEHFELLVGRMKQLEKEQENE